jgi:hypothetical protein
LVLALWINQATQWFSGEPMESQSPLMTRLPHSPGSTLVLRLNQETVHDFILQYLPPCGPQLTLLATWSLEPSLLVFSTPGGLTNNDLSRLFFTCTNTSHTTSSITHHTRKRPSTGTPTTHGPHPQNSGWFGFRGGDLSGFSSGGWHGEFSGVQFARRCPPCAQYDGGRSHRFEMERRNGPQFSFRDFSFSSSEARMVPQLWFSWW